MKLQEVLLRATAGKIKWWQAAEMIGISERQMRRWKKRYEARSFDGFAGLAARGAEQEACAAGSGRAGCQLVSRSVLRSERAAFSREARCETSDWVELHVGEAGVASSQFGEAEVEAGCAPHAPGTPASGGDDASHRRTLLLAADTDGGAVIAPGKCSGVTSSRSI